MTRDLLPVSDPGPAYPAKNTAGPGLPNQTREDLKGRLSMVRRAYLAAWVLYGAALLAVVLVGACVSAPWAPLPAVLVAIVAMLGVNYYHPDTQADRAREGGEGR